MVDTTGAGDGFLSGMLAGLSTVLPAGSDDPPRATLADLEQRDLEAILRLGCHVGSTVCTELGATPPLPALTDLPDHLRGILS